MSLPVILNSLTNFASTRIPEISSLSPEALFTNKVELRLGQVLVIIPVFYMDAIAQL